MKLIHLGCFDRPAEGWLNYDVTIHLFIGRIPMLPKIMNKMKLITDDRYAQHKAGIFKKVKYLDLNKSLPFSDNSVDAFFSSHVLEHLFKRDLEKLLLETFRTLKVGGKMRIVLPDLNIIIKSYNEFSPNSFVESIFENYNKKNYAHYHKWMYTKYSFKDELVKAGFDKEKVLFKEFKETDFTPFLDLDNRPENSFYIEVTK